MSKLYPFLLNQAANKQCKLASRFLKNIQNGSFLGWSSREQGRKIKNLRRLEKRLGLGSVSSLKHWAVAAALGFVTFTATAQQPAPHLRKRFPERSGRQLEQFKKPFNQAGARSASTPDNTSKPSQAGELGFVKGQTVGDPELGYVIFADLDSDGDTDMVQAGYYGLVQVLFNDGAGNFIKKEPLESLESIYYILEAADLDGDGDLDILATLYNDIPVIYLNNGQGSFTKKAFGGSVIGISNAIADFNGDQKLDILLSKYDPETGQVEHKICFNDGNATFSTARIFNITEWDGAVATDVNADGRIDLLLYEWNLRNGLEIMLNDGTGAFTKGGSLDTNGIFEHALAADVDKDGDQDILGITTVGIGTFKNDGRGNFLYAGNTRIESLFLSSFKLEDLNGDGHTDILTQGYSGNFPDTETSIIIAVNDGSGNFQTSSFSTPQFEEIHDSNAADIDADGDLDIVLSDYNQVIAYTNAGTGLFSEPKTLNVHPIFSLDAVFSDFDGDGDTDAATAGNASIWLNQQGTFIFGELLKEAVWSRFIDAADINGDGHKDLLLSTYTNIQGYLYVNSGKANFSLHETFASPEGYQEAHMMRFGDIDSDGDQDLIGLSASYSSFDSDNNPALLQTWLNNGSGSFTPGSTTSFTGAIDDDLRIIDVNKDGKADVVALGNNQLLLFINQGDASFSAPTQLSSFSPKGLNDKLVFVCGDVDGDQDADIIMFDRNSYAIILFRNNGSGGFTNSTLSLPLYNVPTALGDVDRDGDLDLVTTSYEYSTIWLNDGTGAFGSPITLEGTSKGIYAGLLDVDNDQDTDLWWGSFEQQVEIWNNTLLAPNSAPAMASQHFTLNENSPAGTVVSTVAASDPNGDALTFSISQGNAGNAFAINSNTGQLTVANSAVLDFETTPVFNLTVAVSDGLSSTQATITVSLTDVNEGPNGLNDTRSAGISLYPNPSKGSFNISWQEQQRGTTWKLEVLNLSGQTLQQQTVVAAEGSELNLKALTPGLYLLRLSNGSQSYMHRIVKQ